MSVQQFKEAYACVGQEIPFIDFNEGNDDSPQQLGEVLEGAMKLFYAATGDGVLEITSFAPDGMAYDTATGYSPEGQRAEIWSRVKDTSGVVWEVHLIPSDKDELGLALLSMNTESGASKTQLILEERRPDLTVTNSRDAILNTLDVVITHDVGSSPSQLEVAAILYALNATILAMVPDADHPNFSEAPYGLPDNIMNEDDRINELAAYNTLAFATQSIILALAESKAIVGK